MDAKKLREHQPFADLRCVAPRKCPPCHGRCHQGRDCNEDGNTGLGEVPTNVEPGMPAPSTGWVLLIGVLCVLAVGACALIAHHMPLP